LRVFVQASKKEESFSEQLRSLTAKCKEAEARAEFAERSVQKLQKEVDRLEEIIRRIRGYEVTTLFVVNLSSLMLVV